MDVTDETALLTEYVQWKAINELPKRDTSPEEFMRDRMKEVAFDRVTAALDYLDNNTDHPTYKIKDVRAILEGNYNGSEPQKQDSSGDSSVRNELAEVAETTEKSEPADNDWFIPEDTY